MLAITRGIEPRFPDRQSGIITVISRNHNACNPRQDWFFLPFIFIRVGKSRQKLRNGDSDGVRTHDLLRDRQAF